MSHTLLPKKQEFLLDMVNNNYSQKTVDSYSRDLEYLEAFLWQEQIKFMEITKLVISKYKGFLKQGKHKIALYDYHKFIKERKFKQNLKEIGLEKKRDIQKPSKTASKKKKGPDTSKSNFKKKKGLSPRSINRMLTSIRNYLKFLIEVDEKVPLSPEAIKLIKTERKESQVADLGDLISLIECPEKFEKKQIIKARNRAFLELLFSTGMRISEAVNLDRDQLTFYSQTGNDGIAGKLYIKGKGKKSRFVYLTERCKLWLKRYLDLRKDDYPAVFIPFRGGRAGTKDPDTVRISTNFIQEKIAEYRRRLGIVVPTSAHSLRHGFATYLAEEGASPAAIQKLLGHESLQTTTRYVHASDRFAEKAHREYHPVQDNNIKVGK